MQNMYSQPFVKLGGKIRRRQAEEKMVRGKESGKLE